jgi:hypothetical protein
MAHPTSTISPAASADPVFEVSAWSVHRGGAEGSGKALLKKRIHRRDAEDTEKIVKRNRKGVKNAKSKNDCQKQIIPDFATTTD